MILRLLGTVFLVFTCLPKFAVGIRLDPNKYYRLESRDDGWVAEQSKKDELILEECDHKPKRRFKFKPYKEDPEYYSIWTEYGELLEKEKGKKKVLTVVGNSMSSRSEVCFKKYNGSDQQKWQVVDKGDGYAKIISKSSGLVFGHTNDTTVTNPVPNDGTGAQFVYNNEPNLDWLIAESHRYPYDSIGVNQNGWSPKQKKTVVFTHAFQNDTAPSRITYEVKGPQISSPLVGDMEYWGKKWKYHHFYTADLTHLKAKGRYTIKINDVTQEFDIFDQPFGQVRGINGGELKWKDMVDGFLESQKVPQTDIGLDTVKKCTGDEVNKNKNWTDLEDLPPHEMVDGWYDATSRDSKKARTSTVSKFLALSFMETNDKEKKKVLIPPLETAVNHLVRDQYDNGSFPLGKFRTDKPASPAYCWSVDADAGITARHVTALALLAQAVGNADLDLDLDRNLVDKAKASAEKGWEYIVKNPNNFTVDNSDYKKSLRDYYGNQANVVNAAIELYILSGKETYAKAANDRIKEGTYKRGKYEKNDLTNPWPGSKYTHKGDDMVDASTALHLSRYYQKVTDMSIKDKLNEQIVQWFRFWQKQTNTLNKTPWGVPENGGEPKVPGGWSKNLLALAVQFFEVGRVMSIMDSDDRFDSTELNKIENESIDIGTSILDYILGNNAIASSFYMGAGHNNFHPRFKVSSEKTKGAIIPGIKTEHETINLNERAFDTGETVTLHTVPMLLALAQAEKFYPGVLTRPLFYSGTVVTGDAFVGREYEGRSLAETIMKPKGGGGGEFTFEMISSSPGTTWLKVSSDGSLSGTPSAKDYGHHEFNVNVYDSTGQNHDSATLSIDVKTYIEKKSAPIRFYAHEDTYALNKEGEKDDNIGERKVIELRKSSKNSARVGYLKFDISGLEGQTIEGASLYLYAETKVNTIFVYEVDSEWTEADLNWNNRPSVDDDAPVVGRGKPSSKNSWFRIDLENVQGEGIYSFALDEQFSQSRKEIDKVSSRESERGPYIDVVLEESVMMGMGEEL